MVATPVSTGVYFFIYLLMLYNNPIRHPAPSAIISPLSKERLATKYFWTNSIPVPYISHSRANRIKTRFNLPLPKFIFNVAQHHRKTMMANMPVWTHLSNQIFSSQFSFGKALPGIVSNKVEMINQRTGNTNEGLMFFKQK